jgi:hypothetical protein
MHEGTLANQYLARKLALAKRGNPKPKNDRPDDQDKRQPNVDTAAEAEEGNQEPRLSGARLEEMLKLAGAEGTEV